MIQITKGQSNTVVVTLKEGIVISEIADPYYLFVFQNDQSKKFEYCIAQDQSLYTDRYSKFVITEKTNPDNTEAEVSLALEDFWSYWIYEQSSSTNLDPDLCDNTTPLELGKLLVTRTPESNVAYEYVNENVVYNG